MIILNAVPFLRICRVRHSAWGSQMKMAVIKILLDLGNNSNPILVVFYGREKLCHIICMQITLRNWAYIHKSLELSLIFSCVRATNLEGAFHFLLPRLFLGVNFQLTRPQEGDWTKTSSVYGLQKSRHTLNQGFATSTTLRFVDFCS